MLPADPGDLVVEFCRRLFAVEGEEGAFPVGAVSDPADRRPFGCHLVPGADMRDLNRGLASWLPDGAYRYLG